MRKNQASLTAIGIAIVRAIESEKPANERLCYDPYARRFVSPFLFHLVRFFDRLGYGERKGPGVMGFLTVRERHIDDFLATHLRQGLDQLVILGAGLDSRAYRLEQIANPQPSEISNISEVSPAARPRVFEVDHPATQASKIEKVKQVFGVLPSHVTYVAIDFDSQTLNERLPACGYDPAGRSLFIWRGVTQYLTPAAVDATLAFIAHNAPPGSAVIFDYMYTTLLDGTIRRGEVTKMRNDRFLRAEAMLFGIPEGEVTAFLEKRGFTDVLDADHAYLRQAYFHGPNANRTIAYGYAIASATVAA